MGPSSLLLLLVWSANKKLRSGADSCVCVGNNIFTTSACLRALKAEPKVWSFDTTRIYASSKWKLISPLWMHTGKKDFWYDWPCHTFLAGNFIEGFRCRIVFVSCATLIWEQEWSVMMLVSARGWYLPAWLPALPLSFPDLVAFSSSRVSSEGRWEGQASRALLQSLKHLLPWQTVDG